MSNSATRKMKRWRDQSGLTQEGAARIFGVTRMTWYRWEGGESKPRSAQIAFLCKEITGLQPNDFYDLPPLAAVQNGPENQKAAA